MSSGTGDGLTYVALGLAAIVAIMSVRYQAGDREQKSAMAAVDERRSRSCRHGWCDW